MKDIFISYSRFDKEPVFALCDEINQHVGRDACWVDLTGIESDKQFVDVIIKAINQAEIFLFMHTRHSEASEWTKREVDYAREKRKKIVFVNLDNSPLGDYYCFWFGTHDIIDIRQKDQKQKLFTNLRSWLPCSSNLRSCDNPSCPNFGVPKYGADILFCPSCGCKIKSEKELTFHVNGAEFTMIKVEAGTFMMGATDDQTAFWDFVQKHSYTYETDDKGNRVRVSLQGYERVETDAKPVHEVTITHDYYMGKYLVTQGLWQAVMGDNPAYFGRPNQGTYQDEWKNLPVERVSFVDCRKFINKLNQMLKPQLNGHEFSLPSEAEWEFAARGGNLSKGYVFAGSDCCALVANYKGGDSSESIPVGTLQPNELGLYDMSGNVWEWCFDYYGEYDSSDAVDPFCQAKGDSRVIRGGSYYNQFYAHTVSYRNMCEPTTKSLSIGLRLCLS